MPSKLNWKNRLDFPALIKAEKLRREKTLRQVEATRKRNVRKPRRVPVATLESFEQRRVVEGCARRKWKVRKLVSPNVRGWPDLFVMDPQSKRCAFVELKAEKRSAEPSKAQLDTLAMLNMCGLHAFVAWGAADAFRKLEEYFNA